MAYFFCESVRGAVDQRIAEEREASFRDASDAGIEKTVRALLLADVSSDWIVSVTHDVWGISRDEVARIISEVTHDLAKFKAECDVVVVNRWSDDLSDVVDKVYTRDLFKRD